MLKNISDNTNFGMALYMPSSKKITKKFGKNIAKEIELARPKLNKIAKNVDIFVRLDKSWFEDNNPNCWGLMITANTVDTAFMAKIRHLRKIFNLQKKVKGYTFIPVAEKQNPMIANTKNAPAFPNLNEIILDKVSKIKAEVL